MASSKCVTLAYGTLLLMQLYMPLVHSECEIKIYEDHHDRSPLFLDNKFNFMYPKHNESYILRFDWFQDRLVYCPGNKVMLNGVAYPLRPAEPYHQPLIVRCIDQRTFQIRDGSYKEITLKQLECSRDPDITDWYTGNMCGNGEIINIGFAIYPNLGKATIELCHNEALATTSWAHITMPRAIKSNEFALRLKTFQKGMLFKDIFVEGYDFHYQYRTLKKTFRDGSSHLGADEILDKLVDKYIQNTASGNYFVVGHLIPQDDMYYRHEQYTTYFHANTVPMWDSVKGGNWGYMESEIRDLAEEKGDLEIFVGSIGVLQLEGKDIYLSQKVNQAEPVMPVPKILFKLVYSKEQNQALAFIVANNPYINVEQVKEYTICKEYDRCRSPMYSHRYRGYLYCCLFHDFMASPEISELSLPIHLPKNVAPLI